jgi:hypothetical protein
MHTYTYHYIACTSDPHQNNPCKLSSLLCFSKSLASRAGRATAGRSTPMLSSIFCATVRSTPSRWKTFSSSCCSSSASTARMQCEDSTDGAVPDVRYVLVPFDVSARSSHAIQTLTRWLIRRLTEMWIKRRTVHRLPGCTSLRSNELRVRLDLFRCGTTHPGDPP